MPDFVVPEPNHLPAFLIQPDGSLPVIFFSFIVLSSIQLNSQAGFATNEIQNVIPNRMLATKFIVSESTTT